MKSYSELGQIALGSGLRILADTITQDVSAIYRSFNVDIDPKWFPVFYVLASSDSESIVNIAKEIGHSHASVSKIVKEMKTAGLINTIKSDKDSRVSMLSLSAKGKSMVPSLCRQCEAIDKVLSDLFNETGIDLWQAIKTTGRHIKYRRLSDRVEDLIQGRKAEEIQIVDYAPQYHHAFKSLNEAWITQHWEMELSDYKSLENPEQNILQKGGAILIGLYQGKPIASCALIKMDNECFELAKMAVAADLRGKRIGEKIGLATLQRAKLMGAKRVYLESNSTLTPAISLYKKLGFVAVDKQASPYQRCDIQMERIID
ncbi:bifunctional helix-turn-helix transcriptional regulator/GNAT family N-acetyltransferase [Agarilytica rhodophyticola]|uniref:bifunctional helix-turn-helix transcriptional regulator/GNAT family N-acetyltransferase n=1 Tax=Agarilytica rhodophyticola TaxID=1737490 RepID=UPI000B34283F|nr:bifunctional helix-turn-helix transcriptional regulator/GNAT family N-acetyltransferase [Agarilytica rhodophyticola]